jgi:DNA-binding NarL/FixJ family response regulator
LKLFVVDDDLAARRCRVTCLALEGAASAPVGALAGATGARVVDLGDGRPSPERLAAALSAAEAAAGAVTRAELPGLLGAPAVAVTRLTDRERRVLSLVADGSTTREVAARLAYSERTVKNVLHEAALKLGARSRSQAVAAAVRAGLI